MTDQRPDSEKLAALVYPFVDNMFGFFRIVRLLLAMLVFIAVVGAISKAQVIVAIFGAVLIFILLPNAYIRGTLNLFRKRPAQPPAS